MHIGELAGALGILVIGGLLIVIPFVTDFALKLGRARFILVGIGSICIISTCIFLVYQLTRKPFVPETGQSEKTTGYQYLSDRFVFSGKNEKGQPFLVDLSLNRKEKEHGEFLHYYFGNVIVNGKTKNIYETQEAKTSEVLPHLLFSDFKRITNKDHSSREKYEFEIQIYGETYKFVSEELEGDFITKNEPEYTQYANAGVATISVNQTSFLVRMMSERAYSLDYRKTVFFKGHDTLASESIQLILWDELGNFYLIDRSDVKEYNPAYASHVWALSKNIDDRMKKAFEGTVASSVGNESRVFNASVPGLDNLVLRATLIQPYKENEGLVHGELENSHGKHEVYGYGYFHVYGN